ncbi:MAG TPA: ribosome biogenesis GTPase Der [Acidimicrobiia bacterium]|nr:ribosome biogenesis GTPase Der [Acidimicrobiia bacterium]
MNGATPLVAVVGRPNVGKSTLVNRFVGGREAIVEQQPGVTRDRKELVAEWAGRRFRVVDTGGWLPGGAALDRQVSLQAERAVAEADVILLAVDATVGVVEEDARVAALLRRAGPPVIVAVNKVDDASRESDAWAFTKLGLGDPYPVSALHGRGSGDLLDAVVAALPPVTETAPEAETGAGPFSVAIVGRPNVGKSTLFNRLVGDERTVVHEEPGTTRDSIDTIVETDDGPLRFVDTAGMRRRSRVDEPTEYYSLVRALDAVDRADAALVVVDASEGVTHQDQRLAERVDAAGTAAVVLLNKWDLLDAEQRKDVMGQVGDRLAFLSYAPVLKVSALTGRNVRHVLPALREAEAAYHRRVPTAALNRVMTDAQQRHPPPAVRRHRPRVLYATQGASDPPTFTLFATHELPPTYLRYLERRIREAFDLGPTPLKLRVRLRGR